MNIEEEIKQYELKSQVGIESWVCLMTLSSDCSISEGFIPFQVSFYEIHKNVNCSGPTAYAFSYFRGGYRRSENYMGCCCVVCLDFDENITIKKAQETFQHYHHLIVTTKNHQKQKKDKDPCDRFRVILPLQNPMPKDPEEFSYVMRQLAERFGSDINACDAARAYYTNYHGLHYYHTGTEFFNWADIYDQSRIIKEKSKKKREYHQNNHQQSQFKLEDFIQVLGVVNDVSGYNYYFICPYCGDNGTKGNFSVNVQTGKYKCFGDNGENHHKKIIERVRKYKKDQLETVLDSIKKGECTSLKDVKVCFERDLSLLLANRMVVGLPFKTDSSYRKLKKVYGSIGQACIARLKTFKGLVKDVIHNMSYKILIDQSLPGTGKTSTVFDLVDWINLKKLENRVVLLTQSPKQMKENMAERIDCFNVNIGRNNGNCKNFLFCQKLLGKGINDLQLYACRECKYRAECEYIKEQQNKSQKKHIILHPNSYKAKENDIVFVDEGTQLIPLVTETLINVEDIEKTIELLSPQTHSNIRELLKILLNTLNSLDEEITGDKALDRFVNVIEYYNAMDMNTIRFRDAMGRVDTEINKKLSMLLTEESLNKIPKIFLLELYNFLMGENKSLILSKGKMRIFLRNDFWSLSTLISLKKVVIMNGTGEKNLQKVLKTDITEVAFNFKRKSTKIYQMVHSLYPKTYNQLGEKETSLMKKLAKKSSKLGIISYKSTINEVIENCVSENNLTDKVITGYYGYENRGSNKFNDCDKLIVIGAAIPNISIAKAEAKALGLSPEDELKVLPYFGTERVLMIKNYNEYIHNKSVEEIEQAIFRVNRGGDLRKKVPDVYLLTNQPISLEVEIVDINDFTSAKNKTKKYQKRRDAQLEAIYNECNGNISANKLARKGRVSWKTAQDFLIMKAGKEGKNPS